MSSDSNLPSADPLDSPDGEDLLYTLDVIAELAGVDATTVIRYHEQGFLRPVPPAGAGDLRFDAEGLRQLRRMEHLRAACGVNEAGLRLILSLLGEVEELRGEIRRLAR